MGEKRVIVGIYSQRPLGISKEELSYSLYHCYKPLLTYLYANPDIRFLLYIAGTVLEWLESEHPEINMLIADMVKKHQIELCTGGFYDPILTVLPLKDRALQIERFTTFIRKRFGSRAKTIWLTDQIWSPTLISTLHSCSVDRTLLFTSPENGLEGRDRVTMQEMGRTLQILPIDRDLSRMVQEGRMDAALSRLTSLLDPEAIGQTPSHSSVVTIMLDSNVLISESMLSNNQQFIGNLSTLMERLRKRDIQSVLPEDLDQIDQLEGSVPQMRYVRPGCYRQDPLPGGKSDYGELFLHYPELNRIYGKLWYVHRLTANIKKEKGLKKLVSHELLKAESFGAYTQGSWGGLYTNQLRKENYRHLIEAEKHTREKGVFSTALTMFDLDFDGIEEFIYRGKHITAVIDPCGAAVEELDYLVTSWNYLDTFVGHRSEAEFLGIANIREGELQNSFINVLLQPDMDLSDYDKYHQQNTMNLERFPFILDHFDKDNREIVFKADIDVRFIPQGRLRILKRFRFKSNSIEVEYTLVNISKKRLRYRFGTEFNISFGFEEEEFLNVRAVDGQHERTIHPGKQFMANVKNIRMKDLHNRTMITMFSDKRFSLSKDSFRTIQRTLFGEEDIYQYSMLLSVWELDLDINESWTGMVGLRIEKTK